MPEEQQTTQTPETPPFAQQRGALVFAAGILALGGFFGSYVYLEHSALPQEGQTASASLALQSFEGVALEAQSAIVIDLVSGKTLYERNADAQLPLASLTKIPLVLAVLEAISPDERVRIPYDTPPANASMRLVQGEVWKVQDVINFTLITSSNEGADILAIAADARLREKYPQAPQGKATLWRMNELARQLNLNHTYFVNVSGLDVSTTQAGAYGSARDYAQLLIYAASTEESILTATTRDTLRLTDTAGYSAIAKNTNEALGNIPGLIMGKTGFTDLAGGNLAVLFDVGPAHPVAVVVLGSSKEGRFSDVEKLVERTRTALQVE